MNGYSTSLEMSERNPDVEALQSVLNSFRNSPLALPEKRILDELHELVNQNTKQADETDRELFSFLGIPGAGKSKVIEKISRYLNAPVFHVRELVKVNPAIKKDEERYYRSGELLPGIENDFLNLIFKSKAENLLVDGFPRSLFQVLELYRRAVKAKLPITIVEIRLQEGREVFQSYFRQNNRASHRERKGLLFGSALETEHDRIMRKIQCALELDLYVIEVLRKVGAEIIQLDATNGPSKMVRQFRMEIGDDAEETEEDS